MDGVLLLKHDHKLVKGLFREFEKTKDSASPANKEKQVQKICAELTRHGFIEETTFYPAARAADTTEHVLESVQEHHVVAWLLSELRDLDASDETFDAKTMVLIENVRHHMEEEETEFFPRVRKALGRNRLVELGRQMAAGKSNASSDPGALSAAKG